VAGCDTLVAQAIATVGDATLFAKNSDRPPGECQSLCLVERALHGAVETVTCQYLTIPQARETWRVLGSRPTWLWGFEHGLNEHGVAIGNETIFARAEPAPTGLLGMDLVRLGLERATSAPAAVEIMIELIECHGQGGSGFRDLDWPYNNSFLVADAREAWILEAAGSNWAARRCGVVDSISNQVTIGADWERLSRDAIAQAQRSGWPIAEPFDFASAYRDLEAAPPALSEGRLRRSRGLLASHQGAIDVTVLRDTLRDHDATGTRFVAGARPEEEQFYTLCMHQGPSRTAASLIAELPARPRAPLRAWASFSRPCTSIFVPIFLAGTLPRELTAGSDAPGDALWWVIDRLADRAEAEPAFAERVREGFGALEAELTSEADTLADQLIALGESAAEETAEDAMRHFAGRVDRLARFLADSS